MTDSEERHRKITKEVSFPYPYTTEDNPTHTWSQYPENLDFSRLIFAGVDLLRQSHELEPIREEDEDIEYQGPPIHPRLLLMSPDPDESLSAEQIEFVKKDQGRTELQEIVKVILQMGVEQGLRISESWRYDQMAEDSLDAALHLLENGEVEEAKKFIESAKESISLSR